jgi:hypothetical protein
MGGLREVWLKPIVYWLGAIVLILLGALGVAWVLRNRFSIGSRKAAIAAGLFALIGLIVLAWLATTPGWLSYVTVRRFTLDANHAWISLVCMVLAAFTALLPAQAAERAGRFLRVAAIVIWASLGLAAVAGVLMFLKAESLPGLMQLAYTGLEVGLAIALVAATKSLVVRLYLAAGAPGAKVTNL